eukprot:2999474-Rhodomonas_salina.2
MGPWGTSAKKGKSRDAGTRCRKRRAHKALESVLDDEKWARIEEERRMEEEAARAAAEQVKSTPSAVKSISKNRKKAKTASVKEEYQGLGQMVKRKKKKKKKMVSANAPNNSSAGVQD